MIDDNIGLLYEIDIFYLRKNILENGIVPVLNYLKKSIKFGSLGKGGLINASDICVIFHWS